MELIIDDLDLKINSISITRICEKSKHPLGKRLSKIINKQLSKRNLINGTFSGGDWTGWSTEGWS